MDIEVTSYYILGILLGIRDRCMTLTPYCALREHMIQYGRVDHKYYIVSLTEILKKVKHSPYLVRFGSEFKHKQVKIGRDYSYKFPRGSLGIVFCAALKMYLVIIK